MSSLSHWITVRSFIEAFSTGTIVCSGLLVIKKPPTCCDKWRGKPSICLTKLTNCWAALLFSVEFSSLLPILASLKRCVNSSVLSHHANDFANWPTNKSSSPKALPTSRIALRGR